MMRVLGIGDNVCDKYITLNETYPGGQALNFAVNARLSGTEAAYLGVFGSDACAELVKTALDRLGIDRSRCRQYPGENGYAEVSVENGERIFLRSNQGGVAAQHRLSLSSRDLAYIAGFDHVHTTNNGHTDTLLALIKSTGVSLSYDFSKSWTDYEKLRRICPFIDFAFLSGAGLSQRQIEDAMSEMAIRGCGQVVATNGAESALYFDGGQIHTFRPEKAEIVDSLGAGDAFAAGFIVSYFSKLEVIAQHKDTQAYRQAIQACLADAAALALKACMHYGAFR